MEFGSEKGAYDNSGLKALAKWAINLKELDISNTIKKGGNKIKLESFTQKSLETGDRLIIKTPGGGGFGDTKNV